MDIDGLKQRVQDYNPKEEDWAFIYKAYTYALKAHEGQKRASGASYITHPLNVAYILAELELDVVTIVTGLLHDILEDTTVDYEEIEKEFGEEVAYLVDGVTKLGRMEFHSKEEQQAETWRKMFLAMARDIRVILVKLADRTHNMYTLHHLPEHKRKEVSRETLEIYTPLAHRLGIYKIKWELEDLAFRYLNRKAYYYIVDRLAKKRNEREEFIEEMIKVLQDKLAEAEINADISGRAKNIYSIYTKMYEQGKDFNEIYDLTAVRIITDSIKDCYAALGVVHTVWPPIPGHFKDYIAMPKPNMYQSLHTTVVCAENELLEVQIRTWEMHRTAEYGIAAHWRYKEKVKDDKVSEEKLSWLRQVLEWQQDLKDAREFMEHLKIDLFTDEVFVFTPKGDVIDLPSGSIPIDFAYKIHTDIGHSCVGAKINGRIVPLDYQLKTGDIVEIITSKQGAPSRDWLKMVKSSQAKSKIRNWFKKEKKEENIVRGKEILEKELNKMHLDSHTLMKEYLVEEVGRKFNILSAEDVYATVGFGGLSPQQVITKLKDEYDKQFGQQERKQLPTLELKPGEINTATTKGVKVQGLGNLLVRFSRCCSPLPGDDIVGFITRGRGVSIHRKSCPNIYRVNSDERFIEVSWASSDDVSYPVEIEVTAVDRPNLLADVLNALSDTKVNITSANARTTKDKKAIVHLSFVVKNLNQLENIMNKIKRVRDVFSVERYQEGKLSPQKGTGKVKKQNYK